MPVPVLNDIYPFSLEVFHTAKKTIQGKAAEVWEGEAVPFGVQPHHFI